MDGLSAKEHACAMLRWMCYERLLATVDATPRKGCRGMEIWESEPGYDDDGGTALHFAKLICSTIPLASLVRMTRMKKE